MTDLTPEYIELVRQYLAKHKVKANTPQGLYGFIVSFNGFETFISSRECEDITHAEALVMNEPLQAWYLNQKDTTPGPTVREITHDQYCDWLRSKTL